MLNSGEYQMNLEALIVEARKLVRAMPSNAVKNNILHRIRQMERDQLDPGRTIGLWTFRSSEGDAYEDLVPHWKAMADKFHPNCSWFLIRQPGATMFSRAMAMCAHVNTPALFQMPTVFLDVDAFPNASLLPMCDQVKDIGLTMRAAPGLMPVNEGVIVAKPTETTKAFFWAYVATFEALQGLLADTDWGWWGGQLALNALADNPAVTFLSCDTYNFSPDTESDLAPAVLGTKAVVHLKGNRKAHFERVKAYQVGR